MYLIIKFLLSAAIVVAVSEVAKRLPGLGALLASLPLLSVLAMVWMVREGVETSVIAAHSESTFWYVLPTLPMFLILPYLLRHGFRFVIALVIVCGVTVLLYLLSSFVARYFGVKLG